MPDGGSSGWDMEMNDAAFERLTDMMRGTYGIDLRRKRTLVEGRLGRLLDERGFADLDDYLQAVVSDGSGQELIGLLNRLTTNHTYFMREPEHFRHFAQQVLPRLASEVRDGDVRIWCAGCSTGQEAYTLYLLMHEFFSHMPGRWDYRVLATDISARALEVAREGCYDNEGLVDLPAAWRSKYLTDEGDGTSRFRQSVREGIIFRPFNLMEDPFPFRKPFHVIFCRNVMIYFEPQTKQQLVRRFLANTCSGGYLYIGQTETIAREVAGYRYVMPAVFQKEV